MLNPAKIGISTRGTAMLKDELVAIGAGVLATHWDATKQELSKMMRTYAADGRGCIAIRTATKAAEDALLAWAQEQQLQTAKVGYFGPGLNLIWGYVPPTLDGFDATVFNDGSLRVEERPAKNGGNVLPVSQILGGSVSNALVRGRSGGEPSPEEPSK